MCKAEIFASQNFCTPGRLGRGSRDGSGQGVVLLNYHYLGNIDRPDPK